MNWTDIGISKPLYLDLREQLSGVDAMGAYELVDALGRQVQAPKDVEQRRLA